MTSPLAYVRRRVGVPALVAILAAVLVSLPVSPQSPTSDVSATVVDAASGRAVVSAAVTAGRAFTLTATDGSFSLRVSAGTSSLTVERMGYAPASFLLDDLPAVIRLDPEPYLLERLAVEVTRGAELAAGTAMATAAVERERLDLVAGTSVAEILAGVEGVQTSRVGSWGSRAVVRGLTGERLAVLIDGSRVNRACTFGMDQGLASVDPGQVERVEVLSGPGSALYGSGNVGGVINVVTRRPSGSGMTGEIRAGASSAVPGGTLGGHLFWGGDRVSASAALDASSYGDYRTPATTVDGSSYRQLHGDAKVDVRPSGAHRVSFKAQRYEGRDIGWPMMMGARIPEETRTSLSVDYGWQAGLELLDAVTLRAFRQKLDHHMEVDAVMHGPMGAMAAKADAVSFSTTSGVRGQLRFTPSAPVSLDVGAELTRWFAEGTRWSASGPVGAAGMENTFRVWPAVDITDVGAFLQGEARLSSALTVSLGGRADRVSRDAEGRPSEVESVLTGNTGVRAELGSGLGVRGSVGLGYRNPDPMELYGLALKPDGFVYRGRPDLATERSLNAEVALSWSGENGSATLTGFRNRLEDMVSLVLVPDEAVAGRPVREYTTVGSAALHGVTASAETTLPWAMSARVTGTLTRAENRATGEPLVGIPPATADVSLRRSFSGPALRWVELAMEAADAQDRVAASAGEKATPGYAVTHLRAGLDAGGSGITVGVENLWDRSYRAHLDPVRLLRPGRNFFVRVSRAF